MHKYVKFDQAIPYYHVIIDKSLWRVFLLLTNSFGYYKHTKKKKKTIFYEKRDKNVHVMSINICIFFEWILYSSVDH